MFCKLPLYNYILFFLVSSGLYQTAVAQNLNKREWEKSEVVLTNGDTLTGTLSYYYKKEIIQVKITNGITKTFSPVNVAYFRVFNAQKQVFQTFRPFMWSPIPDDLAFKTPAFFEVIMQGKYTLIKRAAYVIRNSDPLPLYTAWGRYYESCPVEESTSITNFNQVALLNFYYVLTPENQIISLRHPKKNLEELYQDKGRKMNAYIKGNKLSYNNPVALSHMVHYFNRL